MRWDWGCLLDPYRPGAGPVVQPWIQPVRRTLVMFRQQWPWVSLLTVSALVVLTTLPMQNGLGDFWTALLVAGAYGLAVLVFDQAERRIATPRWRQHLRGVRKVGVLLALTVAHWWLPAASTELWLLYLIPLLTLGAELDWLWSVWLIAATVVLLFYSAWPLTDAIALQSHWSVYMQKGLIRALLGGYAGATSYLMTRCLAYQSNTIREALNRLLEGTVSDRWLNAANAVAGIIADLHSEAGSVVTANVLVFEPARNKMRLVGSSTRAGQKLAQERFEFDAGQGITGWAARQNEPCFINDTERDPEQRFLANRAFPSTRSALAVPVRLNSRCSAVLEIESPTPNDVAHEDLQLMNHVAHYLLAAHQRSEMLDFHQRLAELGRELADRIIQVEEIGAMLEKIGEVALGLLDADVIRFYYRNPETNRIEQRCTIGQLWYDEIEGAPLNDPQSVVNGMMEEGKLQLFQDAQEELRLIRGSRWHEQQQVEPFVMREGILSCAAMPLMVGKTSLGLMWVNYRRRQEFPTALCSSIQMLAPLAALAIKSGVQSAIAEKKRRSLMRRIVHDSLAHRLHDVARGLQRLDQLTPKTAAWNEERMIVQCQVERARRVVANLIGEQPWLTLQSIIDDLATQAQLVEKLYRIPVKLELCKAPNRPISVGGGNELMFACDEIVGNVVRHSRADEVAITVTIANELLQIEVKDNGIGFDTQHIRLGQGIASIHDRIQRLGGAVAIWSEAGKGTCVNLTVPIADEIREEKNDGDGSES